MSNNIIKGKIQNYERTDKYDDDGNKVIHYWIIVNSKKYTLTLPGKSDIYFENHLEVILALNENNEVMGGLCHKKGYKWGNTSAIKKEVNETDRFELVQGTVKEKRKETFNVNKGTTGSSVYSGNSRKVVTYTIVLPDKNFRVVDTIGKHIKPNTEIAALLEQDVAYIIKDKTNNKIYGKPRLDFVIGLFLWAGFNIAIQYLVLTDQKSTIPNFNMVFIMGNIVFGIASIISLFSYLSKRKTLVIFKQML